jgi:hypothetical protein
VCDDSKIDYFFDCGKGLCLECLQEHLKAQIEKYKIKVLSEKIKFICASSCKCPVKTEEMEQFMNQPIKHLYNEILFKMYIFKSDDILSCPKSNCPSSGFYKKESLMCRLSTCFECPACKGTWTETNEIIKNFKNPLLLVNKISPANIKTTFKKYITTKYCNNCSAPIEKAEGCKHIECNRCEYSFCWNCTGDWKTHKELCCMGLLTNEWDENLRISCFPVLFFYLAAMGVLKILFSFLILFKILLFLIKLILFPVLICGDAFLIYGVFEIIKRKLSKYLVFMLLFLYVLNQFIFYKFNLYPISGKYFIACDTCGIFISILFGLIKVYR